MKTIAVVPVKTISERVESKNFREFHNEKSLFDLLIEKLIDSKVFDEIYVSSNSKKLQDKTSELGIKYIFRDDKFCNNNIPWSDVVAHVAESIPEDPTSTLAWCHTTSPTFNRYKDAVKKYLELKDKGTHDGLMTVEKSSEFILSEKLQPLNFAWGPWHKYSQYLESYYYMSNTLFISSIKIMIEHKYMVSKNPYLYKLKPYESIDIDNEYDFELAKILMNNKEILSKYD